MYTRLLGLGETWSCRSGTGRAPLVCPNRGYVHEAENPAADSTRGQLAWAGSRKKNSFFITFKAGMLLKTHESRTKYAAFGRAFWMKMRWFFKMGDKSEVYCPERAPERCQVSGLRAWEVEFGMRSSRLGIREGRIRIPNSESPIPNPESLVPWPESRGVSIATESKWSFRFRRRLPLPAPSAGRVSAHSRRHHSLRPPLRRSSESPAATPLASRR